MDLRTVVSAHHELIEESFEAWRAAHGEAALVDLLGRVTAYAVAGRRVLAPVAERLLDVTASAEHAHDYARIRVLLLRLCAMKKLGSARIEASVTELHETVARLSVLEARTLVPALDRALPLERASALARRIEVEHDAAEGAFRGIASRARAAAAQTSERPASSPAAAA